MRFHSLLPALTFTPASAAEPPRPNFVFILTDDQRRDCLGVAGHPHLEPGE
jgi:hypothetical protein